MPKKLKIDAWLRKMKVSTRLALAFGVVLILLASVVSVGITRMVLIDKGLRRITEVDSVEIRDATALRNAAFQISITIRNLMIFTDAEKLKLESESLSKAMTDFETRIASVGRVFAADPQTSQPEKDYLEEIKGLWQPLRPAIEQAAALAVSGKGRQAVDSYIGDGSPRFGDGVNGVMRETVDQLVAIEEKNSDEGAATATKTYRTARLAMLGLGIAAAVIAVLAALLVARGILGQLGGEPTYVADLVQSVADGNLDVVVTTKPHDNRSVLFAVRNMIDRLKQVIAGQKQLLVAANLGDFTTQIDVAGLAGFQKDMGDGLNQLVVTTGSSIDDVVLTMRALSEGDLSKTIDKDYKGSFGKMKEYANNTLLKLGTIINEVNTASDALSSAAAQVSATNESSGQPYALLRAWAAQASRSPRPGTWMCTVLATKVIFRRPRTRIRMRTGKEPGTTTFWGLSVRSL